MRLKFEGLRHKALSLQKRNYGTKTSNMFLPNELRYQFEGERLTPEENRKAIPKKPALGDIDKYYREIIQPGNVADLVNRPQINEVFTTALAKDSPYGGTKNYKMVPRDDKKVSEEVNLYFTSIALQWIEAFNAEIVGLGDLDAVKDDLLFRNRSVEESIDGKYQQMMDNDFYSQEGLKIFYESLLSRNYVNNVTKGNLYNAKAATVSFKNITQYLLDTKELLNDPKKFECFVGFIEQAIDEMSVDVLKDLMTSIIYNIYESKVSVVEAKLTSFERLLDNGIFHDSNIVWKSLSPPVLDKAAYLLSMSSSLSLARNIFKLMINDFKVSPSADTLNSYLLHYEKGLDKSTNKEDVLRHLADLKPAIHHRGLSQVSFNIILRYTIDNTHDLSQFLNMVEATENGKNLLERLSKNLIEKQIEIVSDLSLPKAIKNLHVTQLVTRLVIKNKVSLEPDTYSELAEFYETLGVKENHDFIKTFQ